MNKVIFSAIFVLLSLNLAAQYDTAMSRLILQADYLRKSRHQKTAAWILLGTGSSMIATAFILANNVKPDPLDPFVEAGIALLAVTGVIFDLASIPFFISSGKHKRQAAAIGFNYELNIAPQLRNFASSGIPSLKVRIPF